MMPKKFVSKILREQGRYPDLSIGFVSLSLGLMK